MRTFILLLALTAIASAALMQSPADYTKNYENPWTADEKNGKCHDDERIDIQTDDQGYKWATCMPKRDFGDAEPCPKPPMFDSSLLDAFAKSIDEYHRVCVVECSESPHGECPTGAQCRSASSYLKNGYIKNICYYQQHPKPPVPPTPVPATKWYEDPFIADPVNGGCHKDEMVMIHKIDGKTYGECMPTLYGDTESCPKPPGMEKLWLSAYDVLMDKRTDSFACTVECSDSYNHACPKGGVCMNAPDVVRNDRVKNVCLYEQPSAPAVAKVQLLRQNINNFQANFHYEDPFWSSHVAYCTGSQEAPQQYDGLGDYWACMPKAFGRELKCYQDYPAGTTATPMPTFIDKDGSTIRCALVCSGAATGICGPRAECMILPGLAQAQVGVCMYKKK